MKMYEVILQHRGLGKYKVIRGRDENEVRARAEELKNRWDDQYATILKNENGEETAQILSQAAHDKVSLLQNYLKESLYINYVLNKDEIKQAETRNVPVLQQEEYSTSPNEKDKKYYKKVQRIPNNCLILLYLILIIITTRWLGPIYGYGLSFFASLIGDILILGIILGITGEKTVFAKDLYLQDKETWENECNTVDLKNTEIREKFEEDLKLWQEEKDRNDQEVDDIFEAYHNGEEDGVISIADACLQKLPQITEEQRETSINYNSENKILVVNYFLPTLEEFHKLPKEIRYIKSKEETKTTYYPDSFVKKLYDNLVYKIIFAVVNAIYSGDVMKRIESVVVNGYIDTLDTSLGRQITLCTTSLLVSREAYNELNLELIDPKECFKRLKGLSTIQLPNKIPVKPIMQLNREDKRFVESYGVASNIDGQTNLASMDWQDFENLIRELFEKKFSRHGGECKVTQASRDGGVDAIAFDPDPILGGKIIIQAKRYTNIVGVSAVRDLYGTLINEGASKGILITTSDYGSDAHKFAEGKPLVLINGNNLLQLLEEELQTKAYINISEAKKMLKEMDK
ncbi:MAG: restriction endonuclease [Alphaproteobacteria bacterium]|nr:restriction endonuclease [Alphaproteobacteria bacterium]